MAVLFKLKEWKQTSHRFQVTLLHLNTSRSHFYPVTTAPRQAGPENNPCVRVVMFHKIDRPPRFGNKYSELGGWLSQPSSRLLVDGQLSCLTFTKEASHSVEEDCGSFAQD